MHLVPLIDAAATLGVKDARTVRRRLDELRVPVVRLGGRLYLNPDNLDDALARLLVPIRPKAAGTVLSQTARLWD